MTSLVVLADVVLPNVVLTAGVRGRNIRKNERTQTISGAVSVNVQWDHTLREFEVGYVPMLPAAWSAIEGLFEVTDAGAYGFLMLDPKDSRVAAGEGRLIAYNSGFPVGAMGVGYGEPAYSLFKRYTSIGSAQFRDRPITRLQNAALLRDGVPVVVGASPGNAAINVETGRVNFVPDVTQVIGVVTPGSNTVLEFATNSGMYAALAVGQRVFISGISGSAASLLNGRSHEITAKSVGGAPYTLTIATSTTGMTATGGTAAKYPQDDETLTWTGQFYVPVHFMTDEMDWELLRGGPSDNRLIAGPSVKFMQILEVPA